MHARVSRLGMTLFLLYTALYGGFVLLNALSPKTMEAVPLGGVNLAIWYGFGLIVVAFAMALVYGFCSAPAGSAEGRE